MCSVCVWLPVRATLWHAANRTYVVFLWVGSVPIYTEQHSTVQPFSSSATDAFKFNRSGQSKRHRQNTGQIYIYRKQFNVCTCCWIIFEKKKLHTYKKNRIFTYMYEKCASVWEHEWQAKNTKQLAKEDAHRNSRAFLLTIEIFMWNNFFLRNRFGAQISNTHSKGSHKTPQRGWKCSVEKVLIRSANYSAGILSLTWN